MRKIRVDDSCLNHLTNKPVGFRVNPQTYIILRNYIPKILCILLTGTHLTQLVSLLNRHQQEVLLVTVTLGYLSTTLTGNARHTALLQELLKLHNPFHPLPPLRFSVLLPSLPFFPLSFPSVAPLN